MAELTRRVKLGLSREENVPADCDLIGMCADFDSAAEFAALEGRCVAEALREFLRDGTGASWTTLARVAGPPESAALTVRSLPVMPKAAARLLRTSDENTSAIELERIAASDPVLAGKVIGAANSASFGSRSTIVRLREAILRLGIPEARKILLAACLGGLFASRPLQELWSHSVAVAEAACQLADLGGVDRETAYVAGLLHDIGRLGFARSGADARISEQNWLAAGFPLVYAESLAYGRDHADLGAEMLGYWQLPLPLIEAVANHHQPERCDSRLNAMLFLAENTAASKRPAADGACSAPEDLWPDMRRAVACERIGISPGQMDQFELKHFSRTQACA